MQVRDLMTSNPDTCLPTDTCADAGEAMRRRRCGFVPIVKSRADRWIIGVVTDRDLALYLTSVNRPANEVPLKACMTLEPRTVGPDAELEEAATIMERYAVHRLPVVQDGQLIGVLSLKDIARAAQKEWAHVGPHGTEQQMIDIIEAIAVAQEPADRMRQ